MSCDGRSVVSKHGNESLQRRKVTTSPVIQIDHLVDAVNVHQKSTSTRFVRKLPVVAQYR
jgi:hypothetical protein